MTRLEIKEGQQTGLLTLIREADAVRLPCGQLNRMVECKCECGNTTTVRLLHFSRGRIRSCGCLNGEKSGDSRKNGHPLYRVWRGIIDRCTGNSPDAIRNYKLKGITVCAEWRDSYLAFKDWSLSNGYKKGLQIDRRDNQGNYEPSNCRWVTSEVNGNNRGVTTYVLYDGVRQPIKPLLRAKGLIGSYEAILGRIKRGYSDQEAIDTPIRIGNYRRKVA